MATRKKDTAPKPKDAVTNTFHPLLAQLQLSLQHAWDTNPDHFLPVDAQTIGSAGTGIITLLQDELGIPGYTLTEEISIIPDDDYNTLTVTGQIADTLLEIGAPIMTAVFGVNNEQLVITLTIPAQYPWQLTDTFTAFNNTWFTQLSFVNDDNTTPQFILSSLRQPNRTNGPLEAGLNFSALLTLQAPFSSLLQLISNAANPLPVIGKVKATGNITTSVNLLSALPSFTFSVPEMNTLSFDNPSFLLYGLSTVDNGQSYMQLDCFVNAAITLNGYTVPLAARLPVGGSLPLLMLQPGNHVSLGEITGFFTSLFTSNASGILSGALPSYLNTLLNKFSLTGFVIVLNNKWNGFSNIYLSIASINDEGTTLWPLLPGVFELQEAGIALQLAPTATSYQASGSIWGSVAVGKNLVLGTSVYLPIGSGEWVFTASASNAIPTLGQFAQFLGSQTLAAMLPANLANVGGFDLTNLTVTYNPATNTLTSFAIELTSSNTWTIIQNWFSINSLYLQMEVINPLSAPQLTGTFTGSIIIGSIGVEASIQKAAPGADWILQVLTEKITLPSLGEMTQLLGGTSLVNVLPQSIIQNHFVLEGLDIQVNISQQKMKMLYFLLDSPDEWNIITGLLSVKEPGVFFRFDWSTDSTGPVITGSIYGSLVFAGAGFYVEADKNATGWLLAASLASDTPLHLFNAVDAVIPNASQHLAALGVPDVVLVTANAVYNTQDGSYELEGVVNITNPDQNMPWSFNIGQTGISIKNLGIKVTSQTGPDKQPQNAKVFLKGTLQIGATVTFTINYEVGGDLVITGTLADAGQLISIKTLVQNLCDPAAQNVSWTSGFETLDKIQFTNVQLKFLIGTNSSFQVYGTMLVSDVQVNAVFVLTKETTWNFVVGIRISMNPNWNIPGFTNTLSTFNLNQASFALVASSFDNAYTLPPAFGITEVTSVSKGLNFYASFLISAADNRFKAAKAVLPTGTLPEQVSLIIRGLITDPLDKSFVEIVLSSTASGVPLMGWDAVRLKKFSLRLYAEPSIALHGEFIMTMITDDAGNYLVLSLDLIASLSEIAIVFIPNVPFKNRPVIISWKNALGITGLTFYLTDLELGIKPFAGPTLTGTVGGGIDFTSDVHAGIVPAANMKPNTIMAGLLPDPVIVEELKKRTAQVLLAANGIATFCDMGTEADLDRSIDTNIRVEAKVGFMIVPGPEPVIPNKIGLRLVNFTLPYILERFIHITLPDILFPVLFPDICFYASFDPTKPRSFDFEFNGQIVIFGFHGQIAATCNQNRIYLNAGMDPVAFSVNGTNLLVLQRSATDAVNGPYVIIDSAPPARGQNLSASLYCNFFDTIKLEATAQVRINQQHIADSYFFFDIHGSAGQLANMSLHLEYQKAKYLNISGSFGLFLDTEHIPGFSITNPNTHETVKAADQINLKNLSGQGVDLAASFTMILDNRGASPNFTLAGTGDFRIHIDPCDITLHLQFNVAQVNANTISQLPATITSQMISNAAGIFTALFQTAECFANLVKQGLIIFLQAVEAAKVLAKYFETGIDTASKLLSELGNGAKDVAEWLWDIFDSKDTDKNTKALKDNTNYDDDDISQAVKDAAGSTYTPQMLIRDQAYAGYSATKAAYALVYNYPQYNNDAAGTGRLLKANYTYLQITTALHTVFPSQTSKAEDMYNVLQQVFASALTAQQMANALALVYPAKDVALALKTHYPADTDTAAKMATLLITAYQNASNPLQVNGLAGALAPLYAAKDVAKVLKDNFPGGTGTPTLMSGILKAAYTAAGTTLTAADMTGALAYSPYAAYLTAPVIHTLYPNDTQTALQMGQLLYTAYPAIQTMPGDMAIALAAVSYPAAGIATALQTLYQQQVQHAAQMAALLVQAHVPAKDAAPVLKQMYPAETDTPVKMISILLTAYQATPIDFSSMAIVLALSPYDAVSAAPALHTQYPQQTQTATAMLTGLRAAYTQPVITVTVMVQSLKACNYTVSDIATTIKQNYAADVPHALQMAQLLAQAPPFTAAVAAPVLQTLYPADTNTAPLLATVLAKAPYTAHDVAPVIKQLFPLAVQHASDMYAILKNAYAPATLTLAQAAGALANSPYPAIETAPVLKINYPADAGTPELMAAALDAAYPPQLNTATMASALAHAPFAIKPVAVFLKSQAVYLPDINTAAKMTSVLYTAFQPAVTVTDMLSALVAVNFNAYESASPVKPLFTSVTTNDFAVDLVNAYQTSAPLGTLTLGLSLRSAAVAQNDLSVAVHTALPATTAGEMAALLVIAYSNNIIQALNIAESNKISGNNIITAGPNITAAIPAVTGPELAGALVSVFTPPNTLIADLSKALCKSYTAPDAGNIARGVMSAFPATDADGLVTALNTGYTFSGHTLTPAAIASALVAGFSFIGKNMNEILLAQFLLAKYPTLTPAQTAVMITGAFGIANTTIVKVLDAIKTVFASLTPFQSAIALQQAFNLQTGQASSLAQPLINTFSLTQLPISVGCISLALKAALFTYESSLAALGAAYSPNWNSAYARITESVYNGQSWATLLQNVKDNKTAIQTAQSLKTTYPSLQAGEMCPLLAAGYYLLQVSNAVIPMATAMKAAGYTLTQTAGSMGVLYAPNWTAANYAQVVQVYNS